MQTEETHQYDLWHLHLQEQNEGKISSSISDFVFNVWHCLVPHFPFSHLQPPQLNDVEIKETVGGDEKSWGLWHEHRGSLRRYTLQGRSSLIKLAWLQDLKELQQCSSLPTNSMFFFIIINNILTITTSVFYLSTAPPVFESLVSDCTTRIGQTIKLTCKVAGSPKPVVSWLKGLCYLIRICTNHTD